MQMLKLEFEDLATHITIKDTSINIQELRSDLLKEFGDSALDGIIVNKVYYVLYRQHNRDSILGKIAFNEIEITKSNNKDDFYIPLYKTNNMLEAFLYIVTEVARQHFMDAVFNGAITRLMEDKTNAMDE